MVDLSKILAGIQNRLVSICHVKFQRLSQNWLRFPWVTGLEPLTFINFISQFKKYIGKGFAYV